MRQYLAGEALYAIDSLGHSAHAYETAKERLESKFGGKRRQVFIYFEDLGNFPQIRDGNAKDLEQFADLLDSAVISLHEAGKHTELGDGFLCITLQRKLPQSMLASYHRWVNENNISVAVITLKTWVVQESEFQTIANETIHGFTCPSADIQTKQYVSNYDESRTFLGKQEPFRAYSSRYYVDYVEQTIAFGSARNTYRKVCLSVGILQNNFGYVIDV